MGAEDAAWEAQFYPGTKILRNKLGLQDERLYEAEDFLAERRRIQIADGSIPIARTFDGSHLKAIHEALFSDVYEWAGQWRDVTIGKRVEDTDQTRWFLPPQALDAWGAALADAIRDVPWKTLDREAFVKEISEVQTYLNYWHPAREGNGRAARIFLDHIAEQTPFALDFNNVESREWNEASRDSIKPGRPPYDGGPLIFDPMETVFQKIVVDRSSAASEATAALRLAQIGYATPARKAPSAAARSTTTRPSNEADSRGLER